MFGFIIGRVSPHCIASEINVEFTSSRFGRPNDIFDTPSTVFSPSFSVTMRSAFRVSFTPSCSAEAVRVRQSM